MVISSKTVAAIQGSVLHVLFFVIGLGKIRNSFDHPTGNPGYEFLKESDKYSVSWLIKTEGRCLKTLHHFICLDILRQQSIIYN
jgi:hypothetical protein